MAAASKGSACIDGGLRSPLKGSEEFLRTLLKELLVLRMLDHKRQVKGKTLDSRILVGQGIMCPLKASPDI